jgi:tRNA uridine 5-carboxymethylaminomethyl modification enzyme
VEEKRRAIAQELERLSKSYITSAETGRSVTALEFLRRPEVSYQTLVSQGLGSPDLKADAAEQVEIDAKYEGYIRKQGAAVARMARLEQMQILEGFDYDAIASLRYEARHKLKIFRPATLGQASRIDGVTPADMAILMVHLERASHGAGRPSPV